MLTKFHTSPPPCKSVKSFIDRNAISFKTIYNFPLLFFLRALLFSILMTTQEYSLLYIIPLRVYMISLLWMTLLQKNEGNYLFTVRHYCGIHITVLWTKKSNSVVSVCNIEYYLCILLSKQCSHSLYLSHAFRSIHPFTSKWCAIDASVFFFFLIQLWK